MHNLKTIFDKIPGIARSFFKASINADYNLQFYPKKPALLFTAYNCFLK